MTYNLNYIYIFMFLLEIKGLNQFLSCICTLFQCNPTYSKVSILVSILFKTSQCSLFLLNSYRNHWWRKYVAEQQSNVGDDTDVRYQYWIYPQFFYDCLIAEGESIVWMFIVSVGNPLNFLPQWSKYCSIISTSSSVSDPLLVSLSHWEAMKLFIRNLLDHGVKALTPFISLKF